MKSNIVYQYFKKEEEGNTIFIQVDPIRLSGSQLTVSKSSEPELMEIEFEADVLESLKGNGYSQANALEFHLILKGLAR